MRNFRDALLLLLFIACALTLARPDANAQVTPIVLPTTAATTAPTTVPTSTLVPTTVPSPTTAPTTVPIVVPTTRPAYLVVYPWPVLGTPPPVHVQTADYWASATLMADCAHSLAPYVTYEYPVAAQRAATKACGLKTVAYINPFMPQQGQQEYALLGPGGTYAAAAAKDCAGNVITTYAGKGYLVDPHSASATAYFQAVFDYYYDSFVTRSGGGFEAVFIDNYDEDYGASAQPCSWSGFADWTSASNALMAPINAHGAQVFVNDLSLPEAYEYPAADDTVQNVLNSLAPVTGGEQEGFIYDNGTGVAGQTRWSWEMNTEIGAVAAHRVYWAYANHNLATVDPASATGLRWRLFLYASWLLGYDPQYSIYQTWFNTASGLRVMPETGIVPTQPLQTAASSVSELQASSAAPYVREFAACYFRGFPIGPCAAVANPSTTAIVSVTLPQYAHSIALTGSDVLDGGTLDVHGPAVTQLGPQSGAILTP